MKYYRFSDPAGRYIGNCDKLDIYSDSISPARIIDEEKTESVQGDMYFNYGPSAGGLRESVNFRILTPGEFIRDIEINSYYKRRKIKVINDDIETAILKIERVNGFHAASHSIGFLLAVEDALEIDNTAVKNLRIAEIELERIRSNIDVLKGICESAGFAVPENQLLYLREEVARIISETFGHRYFFSSNNINFVKLLNSKIGLEKIKKEFTKIYDGLLSSKIFLDRIQENGIIKEARSTGPAARASGYVYDARIDSLSLPYHAYMPVIENSGDSFARFQVRSREILESIRIIGALGLDTVKNEKIEGLDGSGEGASRIESPAGDLFYYVKINEGHLEKILMVPPSYLNIKLFKHALINNNIFTDFFFVWESFGIWISELEVEFI
ncbi:MAG: Ni,Fe-hydrogenase III large subunit [Ferroplasma sp.]